MLSADPDITKLASIIKTSAFRMQGMIDNILDFARGRMGGAFNLQKEPTNQLAQTLTGVVNELKAIWPSRALKPLLTCP